ncbi:transglycosylase domain-containing protein [Prosthecobacter dejongeii]|uniref:Penicillin-binding protein 1A n=1 Tax=Prosthecobacter dejongeii TaxID=48465 RepID=A0A7W7YNR3_9BACT|nr:transglycosylase domain-containing protein [Prosthecobacter dejongeii]MBB5039330.1 penicillin-binding protein 1A [Prosthecobacter dejongeii]
MTIKYINKSLYYIFNIIASIAVKDEWINLKSLLVSEATRYSSLPKPHPNILQFLIIGEDRRHGIHPGFDIIGITRAIWRKVSLSKIEGASTIAQQLVRTLTNRRDHTFQRKTKEILLAVLATNHFGALQLAHIYLQIAYYGTDMNGLSAAARNLNLNYSQASIFEAAALIARIKYPQPKNHSLKREIQIKNRAQYLLKLNDNPNWVKINKHLIK